MSEWISVEDRSPEEHKVVDAWNGDERLTNVEYYDNSFFSAEQQWDVDDCGFGRFSNTFLEEGVTHWMPLPEPPKE